MNLELKKPKIELVQSYLEFIAEMKAAGEIIWDSRIPKGTEDHTRFIAQLIKNETEPEAPLVPESTYWALIGNQVAGLIVLRHFLNENLAEFGGHIGYETRPSCRGKGIAKEMLRQFLLIPKVKEIGKLLLTCSPSNVASNKTIVANGGKLKETKFLERIKRETNYYWIDLTGKLK